MYLRSVHIDNIRSIERLTWELTEGTRADGWHVIIGDNGSGKSSMLRAIALCLIGTEEAAALRQNWGQWLRAKVTQGEISLQVSNNPEWDHPFNSQTEVEGRHLLRTMVKSDVNESGMFGAGMSGTVAFGGRASIRESAASYDAPSWRNAQGWFSAAYGPFRRFTGGNPSYDDLSLSYPRLARHLSIFGEDVALTESLFWLKELKFRKLEQQPDGDLLDRIFTFINQEGFLPHHTQIQNISSAGVEFIDGNGFYVQVEDLSDGYRSILSMTFELIRRLAQTFGGDRIFSDDSTRVIAPGVVLIDEIDAHLHPTWQRRIGLWFRRHFPKIQFIVTTHSPLVCQAADVGTVFRLPRPGSDEEGRMITGTELDRILYGNILDAYGTELFGSDITRSDEAKQHMSRLAELNQKEMYEDLTNAEREEQQTLRASMPTLAYTATSERNERSE